MEDVNPAEDTWIQSVQDDLLKFPAVTVGVDHVDHTPVEFEHLHKRFIYRVPENVLETAREHYLPKMVSLGPYHYTTHDMEKHKRRALCHFFKRYGTQMHSLLQTFDRQLEYLLEAYDLRYDNHWVKLLKSNMIEDGCFILEVLNVYSKNDLYPPNDPLFGTHGIIDVLPRIKRDMLLLENQVPFRVIRILYAVSKGQQDGYIPDDEIPYELLNLVLRFFSVSTTSSSLKSEMRKRPCLHLLDICREIMIYEPESPKIRIRYAHASTDADTIHLPSATELYEAGIFFDRSSSMHLNNISFSWSTLKIPPIIISPDSISLLANMLEFEKAHPVDVREVTSYLVFMNCLVRDVNDVRLLKTSEIMQIISFDDEYVVEFFRRASKDAHLIPNERIGHVYKMVSQQVRRRIRRKLNKLWVDLLRTYIRTPWGVLSATAAIVLFTFTILQTIYTILSYGHPK